MATETRSRNGCWTCRLRKKKCDESHPECLQCLNLGLDCHGFGDRPVWMDGGARERAEIFTLKLRVARTKAADFQRREVSSSKQLSSLGTIVDSGPSEQTGTVPETITTPPCRTPPEFWLNVAYEGARTVSSESEVLVDPATSKGYFGDETSQMHRVEPLFPFITFQDASLLVHFLEEVYEWQFRFHSSPNVTFNKSWLLWLMFQNRALYLTVLALSASHLAAMNSRSDAAGPNISQQELAYRYDLAIQEFQHSLQQCQCGANTDLWILVCIVMLIYLNVRTPFFIGLVGRIIS
jgi:hypothetical protein